jgi:hypothetical protein
MRRILIEKPEIVSWRHKYLVQMKRFREEGKGIFYVDESWIDSNITFSGKETEFGIQKNYNAGNRLILLHARSENGFVHNAMLVYKAGAATGDYHGQMNGTNLEKWVHEMLAPNLPAASVIVFDNAPYNSVPVDKVPSKYAVKKDLIEWLQRKGIRCDLSMRKEELFLLVKEKQPKENPN